MANIFVESSGSHRYELCMSKPELEYLRGLLKQVQGPTGSVGKAVEEFFEMERREKEGRAKERAQKRAMMEARRAMMEARKTGSSQT